MTGPLPTPAAVLILVATAFPALAQTAPTGSPLACTGPLGPKSSHAEVAAAYGKDNVVFAKIDGAEGETIDATVVFPQDPAKRLELYWVDQAARRGLQTVGLSPGSTWIAPNGVRLAMTLADVEKLNGRPFELSGFDWDYGGMVTDWKGGALSGPVPGGCVVSVGFTVPEGAPEAAATAVSGDTAFLSTDRNMRAVKPVVATITIGYPQP